MGTITPLDVRSAQFSKRMRGIDSSEVRDYLEQVSEEMEELLGRNSQLMGEMENLREKLSGYMKLEETIQKTLIMAQKAAEETVENARKQAELIVSEARNRGREIENEFSQLKSAKRQFVIEFESMMNTFHRHVKDYAPEETTHGNGGQPDNN